MQQYENTIIPQEQVRSTIFNTDSFVFFQDYNKELEKSAGVFIKQWLNYKR